MHAIMNLSLKIFTTMLQRVISAADYARVALIFTWLRAQGLLELLMWPFDWLSRKVLTFTNDFLVRERSVEVKTVGLLGATLCLMFLAWSIQSVVMMITTAPVAIIVATAVSMMLIISAYRNGLRCLFTELDRELLAVFASHKSTT